MDAADESSPLLFSHKKLTDVQALMAIIKGFVGAAILAMPYAFMLSGYLGGIFSIISLTLAVNLTVKYLMDIKDRVRLLRAERGGVTHVISYPEMAFEVAGPLAQFCTIISLTVAQLGAVCAYHIFISRSVDGWVDGVSAKTIGESYTFLPLMIAPVILGVVLTVHFASKNLAYMATIGNSVEIATLVIIVIVGYFSTCQNSSSGLLLLEESSSSSSPLATTIAAAAGADSSSSSGGGGGGECGNDVFALDLFSIPMTLGIAAFAMEGIFPVMPVEHTMQNPAKFRKLIDFGTFAAAFLCCLFGFAGSYIFGSETASVITLNFHGGFGHFVKIALSLALLVSYPVQLFPVIQYFDHFVMEKMGEDHEYLKLSQQGVVCLLVMFTTGVATVFPHFGNALSLVGSIGFSIGGVLIPPILYMKTFPDAALKDKIILGAIFMFGLLLLILGTASNMHALATGNGN